MAIKGRTRAVALHLTQPQIAPVNLTPLWVGARMLGLRRVGPQQVELAGVLLAEDENGKPQHDRVGVLEPRRAAKTTTCWAVMLGLCALRPGFLVVATAQTYVKARERFMNVYRALDRHRDRFGIVDMKRGAAEMSIEWANGSRLWVVTPEGGAFRGDGADRILLDETQEHDEAASADILGGALALMDTRFDEDADLEDEDAKSDGQLIVAGTTGEHRSGMLWDHLQRGRQGEIGIVEYAVPEGTPLAIPVDTAPGAAGVESGWTVSVDGRHVLNEPELIRAHPGIGTLTTLGTIRSNFRSLPIPQFLREYGGQWPHDTSTRAIDPEAWQAGLVDEYPDRPLRYALGYDVAPDQSTAALCAAWRDEDGVAWIEVIAHESGDGWLPKAVFNITKKSPMLRVAYDDIGPNRAVADRLTRARPKPRLHALNTRDVTAGCAQLLVDLAEQDEHNEPAPTLRHRVDAGLDTAADVAVRRTIGDGSFAWGRMRSDGDIAPLVAGTNALRVYDLTTPAASRPVRMGVRRPAA